MKKENRQLAKERKAKQREQERRRKMAQQAIMIAVPALLILVIVGYALSDSAGSSKKTASTGSSSVPTAAQAESEKDITYRTDTSLTVKDGDVINIDYVGSVDGVEFDGGNTEGNGTKLEIGSGSYIDDFEEQLIGHNVGDSVKVTVTFPDVYPNNPSLEGKEAVFKTVINGIQ